MGWMSKIRLLAGEGILLLATRSTSILGPILPATKWVTGTLSLDIK